MIRILYVDDDQQYRWMISELIKRTFGIQVELAMSGNEAIKMLSEGQEYSVVISDYSMSDGNGEDLYWYLNENGILSLFILFTSHGDDFHIRRKFSGETFLGIVSKTNANKLCSLIANEITNNRP